MNVDDLIAIDVHAERSCSQPHGEAGFKPERRGPILKDNAAGLLFGRA